MSHAKVVSKIPFDTKIKSYLRDEKEFFLLQVYSLSSGWNRLQASFNSLLMTKSLICSIATLLCGSPLIMSNVLSKTQLKSQHNITSPSK